MKFTRTDIERFTFRYMPLFVRGINSLVGEITAWNVFSPLSIGVYSELKRSASRDAHFFSIFEYFSLILKQTTFWTWFAFLGKKEMVFIIKMAANQLCQVPSQERHCFYHGNFFSPLWSNPCCLEDCLYILDV